MQFLTAGPKFEIPSWDFHEGLEYGTFGIKYRRSNCDAFPRTPSRVFHIAKSSSKFYFRLTNPTHPPRVLSRLEWRCSRRSVKFLPVWLQITVGHNAPIPTSLSTCQLNPDGQCVYLDLPTRCQFTHCVL